MTESAPERCLVCQKGDEESPLVHLRHRGADLFICPQHLPILIHDPGRLVGLLPGADRLSPAEHHD